MNEKKQKLPVWPKDLPPFAEFKKLPKENYVYQDEFDNENDLLNLIHDIYYYENEMYFLYFEYGVSNKGKVFPKDHLEKIGLSLSCYENYFYKRPWSDEDPDKYSYIRFLPGEARCQWQQDLIAKGPMYCRVQIELLPWKRKQLDLQRITSSLKEKNPIELKPNFFGFGVDLFRLFDWVRKIFKGKV